MGGFKDDFADTGNRDFRLKPLALPNRGRGRRIGLRFRKSSRQRGTRAGFEATTSRGPESAETKQIKCANKFFRSVSGFASRVSRRNGSPDFGTRFVRESTLVLSKKW
ncbi:hypothetical protein TNIN_76201 [Trichonephila inaurata madagascariensis]|uniref:Uncharacterized protein n=1 Tax=Trichonephila inaurata madagascariensis TaxID=2747483 RepID=A0A8X7CH91_9ARAC|nr:hypothetical protein TNIN_76201 [Trichonephila inaurata madagascariensis]